MNDNILLAIFLTILLISLNIVEFLNKDDDDLEFISFWHIAVIIIFALLMTIKLCYKG